MVDMSQNESINFRANSDMDLKYLSLFTRFK